jgi:hypothetical protein
MTWAIVLAAGCSKASPTTPTPSCASSDSCNSTDSQLRACASFATGLYGTASVSCAAGPCPAPDEACASGELDVTGSTGAKTVTPIPSSGSFATALAAGTYQVCAKAEEGSVCIALVLAPGTLLRVDVGTEESPGGDYTQVSVQGTQGMPCDVSNGLYACGNGLACIPQAGAPLGGTCEPPVVSPIGGPCDLPSLDPYRVCTTGLDCTSVDDAGVCTGQSVQGGPCDDGMHVCAVTDEHCDEPSHTCVPPAGDGGYCTQQTDCSDDTGLECCDPSHHWVDGGAGTCTPPDPPGSACDQFYQCASEACDDGGTCGALLPSGSFCVFGYVCASGTCTNSACE